MSDKSEGRVIRCVIVATGAMASVIDSRNDDAPSAEELLAGASATVEHLLALPGVKRVTVKTETEFGEPLPPKPSKPIEVPCPACNEPAGKPCRSVYRAMIGHDGSHPERHAALKGARAK